MPALIATPDWPLTIRVKLSIKSGIVGGLAALYRSEETNAVTSRSKSKAMTALSVPIAYPINNIKFVRP